MDLSDLCKVIIDPRRRIRSLYRIVNKQGRVVPLVPNVAQEKLLASRRRRRKILKARQMGVSTFELIRQLDFVMWGENRTACILAHEQDSIKKLFRIPKTAYGLLDPMLRPELDRGGGSMYEMRFPNQNSKIYVDLESRGDTIHWLHISEAAFIDDPSRIAATMEAVPLDGIITAESTANGLGNWFHELWTEDESFEPHFFPWFIFPEYEVDAGRLERTGEEIEFSEKALEHYGVEITDQKLAFRRGKKSDLKHLFPQEYPEDDATCFLSSGRAVFDLVQVSGMLRSAPDPQSDDGCVQIFKTKSNQARYVCGVDTSEGVKRDWSVAVMVDQKAGEVVAVLRGRWKPFEFANRLDAFCRLYERSGELLPLLAVERNNHGHAVLLQLENHCRYPNLYLHTDEKLGWHTNLVTRPVMIDTFVEAVESRALKPNHRELLRECLTLVEESGKIQAATGKHDDCVMAAAIAQQMCVKSGADIYDDIGKRIRV